jgi:hypothetical protein
MIRSGSYCCYLLLLLLLLAPRFPGGESYRDLVRRLTSVVIDVEQQVIPTLVVSHVSILQCLIAYFRNSPIEKAMSIDIPMHTVIEFSPVRGGGWVETRHKLSDPQMQPVQSIGDISQLSIEGALPIWGDGMPISPRKFPASVGGGGSSSAMASSLPTGLEDIGSAQPHQAVQISHSHTP